MAASIQFRLQDRDLGMVMREVDENLAIFLGMRNGEKEKNDHLLIEDSEEFTSSTSAELSPDSLLPNAFLPENVQIVAYDNFLNSEIDRSDCDWLLSQHDISLLTSEEVEVQDSAVNQTEILNGESISLESELGKACEESASPTNSGLQLERSTSLDSSTAANRRSLSLMNRKSTPRAATPTGRPAKSKTFRASTPASRAMLEPSLASTATSRTTLPSSKPVAAQARSSIPSRATSRPSTPASRPTIVASSKSAPRSATPTRKPATPSTASSISSSDRTSSGTKTGSTMLKNPVPSRGTSQVVKSRTSKPSEMLYLSHDASQYPKATMPRRPASASRGRPNAPATHSYSSNGKPRQKSCSPAKVRAPNGTAHKIGNTVLSRSRGYSNGGGGGDDVNPVLIGTKMVERVVNMRKLAPPKQVERDSLDNLRKSSQENLGFGRSLSKKSLDMAIRHMDIRRSIPDNLRPVATAVLSSSSSGIQSSASKSSTVSVSESPLTSSSDSSKCSNSINSYFLDGNQMND